MKRKTKALDRNVSSYSSVIHSIEILLQLMIKRKLLINPCLFLGGFSGPAKKSQRKRPEKRAAGEAAERIPAGPRHRWHQADISTKTGGGDKRKTRVCPLPSLLSLFYSPLISFFPLHFYPFPLLSSLTPLSHASPLLPHRAALCGWRFLFFFPSLPLARPLCA